MTDSEPTERSGRAPAGAAAAPLDPAAQAFIERKLRTAWAKERRFHHTRGLCYLLVWVVALILLDLVVDWLFLASYRVPGWGRVLLLAVNVVVLLWAVHHYWWRHLRRYDPVRVSLQVERKHPELRSLLVSYVQMDELLIEQTHASPGLVRAVRREAARATRPMDFREIVSFQTLGRLFVVSACVLGLFAGLSAYKTDFFRTLLRRMLNPVSQLEYPTRTVIEEVTGSVSVQQGSALTLAVRCSGELPDKGRLYVKATGGSWERLTLLPSPKVPRGNLFTHRFLGVQQSFDYYARLGDDESDVYHVEVIPAPKVVSKEIILELPPHALASLAPQARRPRRHDSYYIEVPEGTKITWRLTLDRPVRSAEIVRNGVDAFAMEVRSAPSAAPARTGRFVERTIQAWRTFEYQFRWGPAEYPFLYTTPMPFVVNVVPDTAPEVEIVEPVADEKATVRKRLTVTYRGRDDHGLTTVYLVCAVDNAPEKRWKIDDLSGTEVTRSFTRKLADLIAGLKEDVVVTYWLEVEDNYPGQPGAATQPATAPVEAAADAAPRRGPNVGRSQKRRIYVVSILEYLRSILEERLRWISEVEELRAEEKTAAGEVDSMKKTPIPPTTKPSAP